MKQHLLGRWALGVGAAAAAMSMLPAPSASAATTAVTSWCPEPAVSQPFAGDGNWYTLAPGESADSFLGAGWTLTGGAKIVTESLSDGSRGEVLDLPAGSTATSPSMCVDASYPTARMIARTLGSAPDNSTKFFTVAAGGAASGGMPVLGTPKWAVTPPDSVSSSDTSAHQVQFRFVAGAKAKDLQVYNLYIDPRMHW